MTAPAAGYGEVMGIYHSDLQAAVDATSVAKDAHQVDDLETYLRQQLAERDVETSDDEWIRRTAERIEADPNYMIEDQPSDFTDERPDTATA